MNKLNIQKLDLAAQQYESKLSTQNSEHLQKCEQIKVEYEQKLIDQQSNFEAKLSKFVNVEKNNEALNHL